MLALTELDLYIPVLTYVFGEAQLAGDSALVSAHRLRQEFYGMPANRRLLDERLLKESLHELGHTLRPSPLPGLLLRDEFLERHRARRFEERRFLQRMRQTIEPNTAPSAGFTPGLDIFDLAQPFR